MLAFVPSTPDIVTEAPLTYGVVLATVITIGFALDNAWMLV